ncbi:hypothetical protein [Acinetobacter baumannii]|nr:hypothetical protein [Acinetobacter baumannii]MCD9082480.1 hypothetical protein [Acinetobacter baumannii]MCV7483809.1 hypothetical protein [Acinetobacter baumannii]RDF65508.1 hypothetical protein DWA12_07110 [Acinetobacter baumannii]TDH88263.1 hypothetical protein DWA15_19225 [Acinetobacter baumannii]TDI00406.1 hypothetical protein DWA14_13785 [Acinetobacter baumannii]
MRTNSQLFPENKDTSVTNDMADIHSLAEDDLRDTELLIRMAIKNLKQVIEVEKLFESVFADVLRTLRLAEEKACESAYWHGAEASLLTGSGKYQRTAVKASGSSETQQINQDYLAPANAAISKTLTEGFKNDGRR